MDGTDWDAWQAEHAAALRELQELQRLYHRLVTERAFASEGDLGEARREALTWLDEARRRLDGIRERQP